MRIVPPALQAHLDARVTTLARCWKLARADGEVMGFTEHDRDLTFGGVTYRAAAGFMAAAIESQLGLGVSDSEAAGALSDDALREADIEAGLYDGAEVEIILVNWQDPVQRLTLFAGQIGEVRRRGAAFEAELRSRSAKLNLPVGRTYQLVCDAVLGDARCGVDLTNTAWRTAGTVSLVSAAGRMTVTGLSSFAPGWFAGGVLTWTSGANMGRRSEVTDSSADALSLSVMPPDPVSAGDGFAVTAGCAKSFAVCKSKFANAANFRGFPHMPGNDWALSYPSEGDHLDGGRMTP